MQDLLIAVMVSLLSTTPGVTAEETPGPAATKIEVISSSKAPKSVGPFSQGIRAGGSRGFVS